MGKGVFYKARNKDELQSMICMLCAAYYAKGDRVLVQFSDAELYTQLDNLLWTYEDCSFLPHGKADKVFASELPILLTMGGENVNNAEILVVVAGADLAQMKEKNVENFYKEIVVAFDNSDPKQVEIARAQWAQLKQKNYQMYFHKENK